jgi:beta-lactamase class A
MSQAASGVYGFYILNLNTEENYGVNEDEAFQAASLIKLPVMAAIYSEYEKGNLDLDDNAGDSEYSYRGMVEAMGKRSDNTAFNLGVELLGEDLIESYIDKLGMSNTSYEGNETTPRDIGIFFKSLWERKIVDRGSRDEILKSLTDTIYEDWIPAGIPDVRVAHKFGREVHVVNDAGIVFGEDPYVLVIMSKGVVEAEADKLIPELAGLLHRFENQ